MNSWKSTLLSACAPPLSTFIIGTGSTSRGLAAEVAPQRQPLLGRLRVRRRQRHAEDRVGAEARLVRRAVERDQRAGRAPPGRPRPCPAPPAAISPSTFATARVTPLPPQRSPPSRSSVASNSPVEAPEGTAARPLRAGAQPDLDLDRRVAAAVEDLAGVDSLDLAHAAGLTARPRAPSPAAVRGRSAARGAARRGRRASSAPVELVFGAL